MLRMRKIFWALLCALSAATACADSTKEAVNAFRDSVAKSQLVLRNFSGEEKVHASWSGMQLELDAPRWRTFGVVIVDSVKVKGQTLTLHCVRHVVVRDKTDKIVLYAQPDSMEIDVNLNGAEPGLILPKLRAALFYSSIDDAVAAIPNELRNVIPARVDKNLGISGTSAQTPSAACDCAVKDKTGCDAGSLGTEGMVPPRYVSGHDPEFSDPARRAKLNGYVDVRLMGRGRSSDGHLGCGSARDGPR
jgi:hypothetical protein